MGREWLYKASTGLEGCSDRRGGGKTSTATATKPVNKKGKSKNSLASGCMSMIFNLFDIQHHQFRFHHPSFMSESTVTNQQQSGIEAPRSSLESPESAVHGGPSLSKVKEQTNLNLPAGRFQIRTKQMSITDEISSQCSNSPSTKTPTLVARLMGLDLLPEYSSPRPSSSSAPTNSHRHSHSLPSTPRISIASRRSTDNDYHHRLSLQIDKENCNNYRGRRRSEIPVNQQDDLKSQYAKEITNQVRERISRRLGTDITNTMSQASKDHRRDSNLVLLKPKKSPSVETLRKPEPEPEPKPKPKPKPKPEKPLRFTNSPKLRLLDIKSNLNKPVSNKSNAQTPKVYKKSLITKNEKPVKDEKIKRIASERYDLTLKKKSTKLPNHVLNVKNTTKILSIKKEMTPSSSPARSCQLQVSLPSRLSSPYKVNNTHNLKTPNTTTIITTTSAATATANAATFSDHFNYIAKILNQCGITSTTPIASGQWHSHSHPLNPTIFHQLEKHHHPTTTTTATRRIIFDFVNESLVDILKPYMTHKPDSCVMHGLDLIKKLCDKISSIPAANCESLEDIDGLIAADMGRCTRWLVAEAVEMEEEGIVKEIESEIVDSLVHEIATWHRPARSDNVTSPELFT